MVISEFYFRIAAYNKLYYNAPWYRVSPYLVGIILGYILHTTKKTRIVIPKVISDLISIQTIDYVHLIFIIRV